MKRTFAIISLIVLNALAFLPSLLIAVGRIIAWYSEYSDIDFYFDKFTSLLDTAVFTVTLAFISAIIYVVAALIRSRKHYY